MHEYTLLEILAAGFSLALVFGYLAKRLKLSPIVGYLLAGFLVGPHSPGYVADMSLATQLSEAGVILLMFGVGLHFSLDDLFAVKGVALPGAIVQSTAATAAGAWVGVSLGLSLPAGILLGLGLAVASTVVLLRVLSDNNMVDTVHGHVSIGWLVVEDLITVFVLVLLPSVAGLLAGAEADASGGVLSVTRALGEAVLCLIALWVTVLVVGGRVVPWLLTHIVRTRSQELFTLTVLVAAFATAVGAAVFFHASMALGAFLGGMVIGKTRLSHQAGADILPLRDAFAVLFFLSVGMLFNPAFLLEQPLLIAACLGIVLLLKPLTAILVTTALGYSTRTALVAAISLAQVGEFSFILAQQAQYLGIIPDIVYNVLVACALASITVNSGLFSTIPRIEAALKRREKLWHFLNARAEARALKGNVAHAGHGGAGPAPDVPIAVVVGYGPTGRSVAKALPDSGVTPVVIDLNVDTINRLSEKGAWAVFGDASKRDVLLAAGIERAGYLILTVPAIEDVTATAAMARSLNPDIRILARARFLEEDGLLRKAGVTAAAFEEEEVAKSLRAMVLEDVRRCAGGACPDPARPEPDQA